LIDLVERLYDNLKNADRALTKEKARRSGREKSLIKLAKELRKRKEMVADCMERIEEVTTNFVSQSCENSFLWVSL
jgi:hypothetical protein